MILWKIVLLAWLVILGNCDTTADETDVNGGSSSISSQTPTPEGVTHHLTEVTSEISETPTRDKEPDSSSSSSSTSATTPAKTDDPASNATTTGSTADELKSTTKDGIDTDGDTILTPETSPKDDTTTTETPTIYGNDESSPTAQLPTTEEPRETACSSSPCVNGGNCTENFSNSSVFVCVCPSEYDGLHCEVTNKCIQDENGTVCKDGACVSSADGLVRFCDCFHGMLWNEAEMECRNPDPPCFPNPCENGGTCRIHEGKAICECPPNYEDNCTIHNTCGECLMGKCVLDTNSTTKYCKCNAGFYWNEENKTCEIESLPCVPNPCENGGNCFRLNKEEFNCSCTEGFSGTTCEIIDKCSSDEDCGSGTCTLSDDETTKECHCDSGFYLEEQSYTCQAVIKPCQPNPCSHGGICIPSSKGTFTCICPDGYTGKTCTVRDMCVMDGGNTFCGDANCTSVQDLEVYYCSCVENQYFDYSQRKCLDLDLCTLTRCAPEEKCVRGKCECKENYHKNNDTGLCEPRFCSSKPCPVPGMICEEGLGSTDYQCRCKDGEAFNGTHCNEVSCIFPQLNTCEQTCTLKDGGYKCGCEQGFQLNEDNSTCTYSGNNPCTNKTCDVGSCEVKKDVQTCICPPGYIEDKGKCVDICKAGRMKAGICPENKCETVEGKGFKCKCEGKYDVAKDGVTCMVRNVCAENQVGWKTCSARNARCLPDWSKDSGFTCKCQKDQIETEGMCRGVCSIASNQRQCSSKGAICDVDSEGKMICRCPPYFKMNTVDRSCNKPADRSYLLTLSMDEETYQVKNRQKRSLDVTLDSKKILLDASVMAREMFYGFTEANIVSCKSESGFILCKLELQFQTVEEADLKRLNISDVCVTVDNSNRCILPPSLVLAKNRFNKADLQLTDPCDEDIKKEVCGSETTCTSHPETTRHFNCSCNVGFSPRRYRIYPFASTKSFIETCKDIDECVEDDPCTVNSDCVNTIGSFLCSCKRGFRKVEDQTYPQGEKCVDICNPNPCTHGQCSTRGDHEFDCTCDAGYRGTFCNLQDQNFKEMRINTVIVGVVLGGILLITIILFIACISRLRKKKSLEDGNMYYGSTEMVTPI